MWSRLTTARWLAVRAVVALAAGLATPATHAAEAVNARARPKNAAPMFDVRQLSPYFMHGGLAEAARFFAIGDFARAAERFQAAVQTLRKDAPLVLPARFLHALALAKAGRPAEAAPRFEHLWQEYPLLSDYHAFEAARAHLLSGDARFALAWSARVDADSVLRAEAELVALEALERLARWSELAERATAFLDRFLNGPRRAEARFRQGLAYEKLGRPAAEVVAAYRLVWKHAPTESWAARAEERILAVTEDLSHEERTALRSPAPADWLERGYELGEKQQNAQSEAALQKAIDSGALTPEELCRASFLVAQAIFKQRQRARAIPFFDRAEVACRAVHHTDFIVKSLYQGARCRATAGDRAGAWQRYALIEDEFPRHSYADDARLRAAELYQDQGEAHNARTALQLLVERYPDGDLYGEAMFRLAFAAYQAGLLDEAARWLEESLRRIPRETPWYAEGRTLYWSARVEERRQRRASAVAFYERAIREYPLSVYALMAFERLRAIQPERHKAIVSELRSGLGDEVAPVDFGQHEIYASTGFARAVELARLALGDQARRELARLGPMGQFAGRESRDEARQARSAGATVHERALWLTAVLLDRGRAWSSSHAIPRYTLQDYKLVYPRGAGAAAWRLAYPRAFPELVEIESKKNNVPVSLQLALMREESAFNPRVESFANAIGLTQMLLSTAQRFATKSVTRESLFDPAENIALGSKFLSFLLVRFARQVPLAVAGYNAGEAAVDRWLKERGNLPLDEFLETIPYDETRGYTKRVLASYFAYTWLYDKAQPVPRLSFNLLKPDPPNVN